MNLLSLKKSLEEIKKKVIKNAEPDNRPEVIILIYQRPHNLKSVLAAFREQTYKNFYLRIINNNSSVNAELEKIVEENFLPKIILEHTNMNLGFAARFQAIKKSRGNPIIFIDDDMIPERDFVEYMIEEYKKFNGKHILGWHAHIFIGEDYLKKRNGSVHEQVDHIGCGSMVSDKKIIEDIPEMLNMPDYANKMDDMWLSFNAQKHGYKLIKIEKRVKSLVDQHDTYLKIKNDKRNFFKFLRKKGWRLIKDER